MIVVTAYLTQNFTGSPDDLELFCEDIVPATLNRGEENGKHSLGDIKDFKFVTQPVWPGNGDRTDVGAFLVIQACDHPERAANRGDHQENILLALNEVFKGNTFGVWLILVEASCSSSLSDTAARITNMSTEAAVSRVKNLIDYRHQR